MIKATTTLIPGSLRELRQWVLWKTVTRKGKPTKVPYQINGVEAKSNDPMTWTDFDSVSLIGDNYSGVGFMFSPDDSFTGVDLDGCRDSETREITEWARDIIKTLNSYSEVSPSKTGVKIFLRGNMEGRKGKNIKLDVPKICDKSPGIEVYESGRYFAVTGWKLEGSPDEPQERQEQLSALLAKYAPLRKPLSNGSHRKGSAAPMVNGHVTAEEIYERYRDHLRQAISGQGGQRATFGAMCFLWRVIGDDSALVREVADLWNASHTGDEQWSDYELNKTIENARQEVESSGELGKYVRRARTTASGSNGKEAQRHNPTDLGNAGRFAEQHRDKARYCYEWGRWVIWTGKRWEIDNGGHAERLARPTVRSIYKEAADAFDPNRREALAKWATQSEKAERIAAMLKLARSEDGISIKADVFDRDPMLLNCANGIVDLTNGELRPHDPAALMTKIAPHNFDLSIDCPIWKKTVSEVFAGNESLMRFFKRAVGYTLTGRTSERCLFFLHGSGCNGKTTLVSTLEKSLGDYATTITTEMLMLSRNQGQPHEICDLAGRRLALANETESGRRFAESLVKQLTGGEDKLKGRRLYQDFWEFSPTHKLWISGNHRPVIVGNDAAIWDRIRLIPFGVRFENPDRGLSQRLEAELDGILRWAVVGAIEWQSAGLGTPQEVADATGNYRADMDLLGNFIDDRCLVGSSYRSKSSVLYSAYHDWAESNGERPESQTKFGIRLSDSGFKKIRNNGIWYEGITTK